MGFMEFLFFIFRFFAELLQFVECYSVYRVEG